MSCAHRRRNGNGAKCSAKKTNDEYCRIHLDKHDHVNRIAEQLLGQEQFDWDKTMIYAKLATQDELAELIHHIIPLEHLCQRLGIKHRRKVDASQRMAFVIQSTLALSKRPFLWPAMVHLQQAVKRNLVKNTQSENDKDPFTLEPIGEIKHLFTYRDQQGKTWSFSAPHLRHWIDCASGPINPFTRAELPPQVVYKLSQSQPTDDMRLDEPLTAHSAIVDALYQFDRIGFYTNMEWFTKLRREAVVDLIFEFNALNHIPTHAMTTDALFMVINNTNGSHDDMLIHLAQQMKTMIQDERERRFGIACNFLVALTRVSRLARRDMPTWVYLGAV